MTTRLAARYPYGSRHAARSPRIRAGRVGLLVIGGLLALLWMARVWTAIVSFDALGPQLGKDFTIYTEAAQRWLAGGSFYLPHQLAGPYVIDAGDVLYPPVALVLFVPFAVLPAPLWWAVPMAATGWVVWSLRPALWGWVTMLALVTVFFIGTWVYFFGTPTIWIVAFVALGIRFRWPAALVLLKPTLAPLALIGARDRRWWIAAAALAGVSLVLLPMWLEYVTVLVNARGPRAGWWYSLGDLPLMLVPIVAWASSQVRPTAVLVGHMPRWPSGLRLIRGGRVPE